MMPSSSTTFRLPPLVQVWRRRAILASGAFVLLSVVGGFLDPNAFFEAYLVAFLFWLGLALGPLALLMLQYLTGGAWGLVVRRPLEAAARLLPWMAVLFIPIIFAVPYLFHWAHADLVAADPVLLHRSGYMNTTMFIVRACIYFAVWILLAYLLNAWSRREDAGEQRGPGPDALAAPGLLIYVFTLTFAAVDWGESLQDHWYSTMWGFLFVASQGLSATCLAILALTFLAQGPLRNELTAKHFHDLGKILLAFVMLWSYFAFSQLLIVWSGNLPEEIAWYLPRLATSWGWVGGALIVFQFLVPFLLLLSRSVKQNPKLLSLVVVLLLGMRWVDMLWVVLPDFHVSGFHLHWLDITVPLAMGGIWVSLYLHELAKEPLLPLRAPGLEEALQHGRH